MSEPQDKEPTEVLHTKRLEIVDDEGKVRAVLATDEQEGHEPVCVRPERQAAGLAGRE